MLPPIFIAEDARLRDVPATIAGGPPGERVEPATVKPAEFAAYVCPPTVTVMDTAADVSGSIEPGVSQVFAERIFAGGSCVGSEENSIPVAGNVPRPCTRVATRTGRSEPT